VKQNWAKVFKMCNLARIPIVHITHISNLSSICSDGYLWSDAVRLQNGRCEQEIGLSRIKQRRLTEIEITCNAGTMVGQYVPFYFYIYSPMLFYIHKKNEDLSYKGGQEDIVHLVSTLEAGIQWVEENQLKWAFSTGNAGAYFCDFYNTINDLNKINWDAVKQKYWNQCKDAKQAEFLVHEKFSWTVFKHIGVFDESRKAKVEQIINGHEHKPIVKIERNWYY
jgi:hypothetical protein